jgi:hypothetical protein
MLRNGTGVFAYMFCGKAPSHFSIACFLFMSYNTYTKEIFMKKLQPKNYYVYAYINEQDDNPYYIGKGKRQRMYNKHKSVCVPSDLSKIIVIQDNLTEQQSFDLEMKLIAKYGRQDKKTGILLNRTNGGDGISGYVCSEQVRLQRKLSRAKQIFTPEQIAKAAASRTGLKRSQSAIDKTAIANKGRKNSPEAIANFSIINSGENNPQFGKVWINNSHVNKLVTKEVFQSGYPDWKLGRLMKHTQNGRFTSSE